MADVFTKRKRSKIMSRVRSKGNKATELALLKLFRNHAISGWRRGSRLLGRPDFVFLKRRLAVFVDGCFWHACPRHGSCPTSNAQFWQMKIRRNRLRDRLVNQQLKRQGWAVMRIWQHELTKGNEKVLTKRILKKLKIGYD